MTSAVPGVLPSTVQHRPHQSVYDGRVFDDYTEGDAFVQEVGFPELMSRAVAADQTLPDGRVRWLLQRRRDV